MPELDQMSPGIDGPEPQQPQQELNTMPGDIESDHEGAMAKADLYKLANYSHKLFQQIDDNDQLEAWVQAKITKAADYIASVYHYLEYEMKFSEYGKKLDDSDVLSEGQKRVLKARLMEAKAKVKELKQAQVEKVKEEKSSTGGEITRGKGFTRHTHNPDRFSDEPHGEVASKVKAQSAADKAGDKASDKAEEKEGKAWEKAHGKGSVTRVKDGKKVSEAFDEKSKAGDTFKTRTGVATKTSTGVKHTNTSHSDEEHGEPASKVKARSAADKAGDKAADKAQEKDYKAAKKANPTGVRRYSLGKQVDEALDPVGKEDDDVDNDGKKNTKSDKYIKTKRAAVSKAVAKDTKVDEAKKGDGNLANNAKPYDKVTKGDVVAGRLGKDEKGGKAVKEAAPSAGLSKAKKSAVVKDAKAGKDIGKPGKNFDKTAKAAGGGEKGKKIAAAAMWKNIKEATKAEMEEGSIQGGVWTSAPPKKGEKDVPPPQNDDQGTLKSAPKKPVKKAEVEADTAVAESLNESADLNRMKQFLTRLNG